MKAYVGQHGAEKDNDAPHTLASTPPLSRPSWQRVRISGSRWLSVFGLSAGRRGDHAYFDRAVLQRTQRTRERVPARLQKKGPPAHQVSALRCAQREYRLASRICALFLKMCCLLKLRRGYLRVSVLAVCQETTCEARGRSAVSRAVNDDQPSVRSHPCRIAFARTTDGFQVNIALLNASS